LAIEDLTTWTEADPQAKLTVDATSVTINNLERNDNDTWVDYDFGSGYFSGDFTFRFEYTTPASGDSSVSCWIYPFVLSNALDDPSHIESASGDFQSIIFSVGAGPVAYLYLDVVENGTRHTAVPDPISFSTKYYVTLERADSAGVNGTGQLTLRLYTGNYYGESGAVEHDTVTQDCGVGEQNDFQYVMLAAVRGDASAYPTDGVIENVDLSPTTIEIVGTISGSSSLTGTLSLTKEIAGTISGTATLTGFLTYGPLTGAKSEHYQQYLVAFGNDTCSFES